MKSKKLDVLVIGAGMIVQDQILPSLYHLQRMEQIGSITICGTRRASLKALRDNPDFAEAFPGQSFKALPDPDSDSDASGGDLYKSVLKDMAPNQAVIIALPDQLHYPVTMDVLDAGQHVLCVKPLVLQYEQSVEIENKAKEKNLYCGVEYHKRYDRRTLVTRKAYREGKLGDFVAGEAKLIEPYYYRNSNFQNWFTCEETDPFVYIGCHYVDLVYFVTNLKPTEVSVNGVTRSFPNGKKGYMWSIGCVRFENDGLLSILNGLGYPDEGGGSNEQCLSMFFEGEGKTGTVRHNDQFRGMEHSYLERAELTGKAFHYINPDYFKFIPYDGDGYKPVGYGYESIEGHLQTMSRIEGETEAGANKADILKEIDERGIMATAGNSYINELVCEAARKSILNDGQKVKIQYGDKPGIV